MKCLIDTHDKNKGDCQERELTEEQFFEQFAALEDGLALLQIHMRSLSENAKLFGSFARTKAPPPLPGCTLRCLRPGAHRVFTPTLTGVGERSHLLSRDVGLDTHIADVANLMIWENLRDIVLVGHSYGGVVARHVADRMPDRIRSLIYLDAFVPENGNALFDYLPDDGKSLRELAVADGDGWKIPPRPASVFAVNAADAAWVDRQCTMHPLSTCEAPAQISGACDGISTIGYILARGYEGPFGQFYAKAGERRWWQEELACGHDVMLDMPNELTALLLQRT
jgi:pimeloyl-ACP methyl ester carboxylesterase